MSQRTRPDMRGGFWTVSIGLFGAICAARGDEFRGAWPERMERTWIGPEYWANRLHDWRIAGGRLECLTAGEDRNVHVLTCELAPGEGDFEIKALVRLAGAEAPAGRGWVGFRAGARGQWNDYRDSAIRGVGIDAGLTFAGRAFVGTPAGTDAAEAAPPWKDGVVLILRGTVASGRAVLELVASDARGGEIDRATKEFNAAALSGNVVLVCHTIGAPPDAGARWQFRDWRIAGSTVKVHPERTFGPILFSQYTLSRGVLKMTAQMAPIGKADAQTARLQASPDGGKTWTTIAEAPIDALARTATFRVERWDAAKDTPYRVAYTMIGPGDESSERYWRGTVRREPTDKKSIVVAAFTGNNDLGFPNADIVRHVDEHDPDVLVFTGDQIYERVGGYGVQRRPLEAACLDYLRKWYLWGWSFGELSRDRPCVCLPDDHDVFHGNLWGAGGRPAKGEGIPGQDSGGYTMPPAFVNMVQRTQTSHLPDPFDPTPVAQGIGVYYCAMNYGGVSFAIIEDRKFKSAPQEMLPQGKVVNGWFQNPDFDAARQADVPGAELLGERQRRFLEAWAADWSGGAWMKVVASQTIFANVATLPPPANTDVVLRSLPIPRPGEYPDNETPVADCDSNGWPQTGRNQALREMRRGFAFHIAGDQHLGTTDQYGIDEWRDAGYVLCVPSIANLWPRRWFPPAPGANRAPGAPRYTGDYRDGFGNRVTVYAAANPVVTGRSPAEYYDKSPGYGIARFDRDSRKITIEVWPPWADPKNPSTGGPYPGWPITIDQMDNYGRTPTGHLPMLRIEGANDPVVQVADEAKSEIVYTLRIRGSRFRPPVFAPGPYTISVSDPEHGMSRVLASISPDAGDRTSELTVRLGD